MIARLHIWTRILTEDHAKLKILHKTIVRQINEEADKDIEAQV